MSAHKLCIRGEIIIIINNDYPCKSKFLCMKLGLPGSIINGLVYVMERLG